MDSPNPATAPTNGHRERLADSVVQNAMNDHITIVEPKLRALNKYIYENPELAFKEHKAHDAICDFLEDLGLQVTRHAYGLETAFEAIAGHGGRTVNFNAEFDALPGIGHACGHNLITTAALTGFVALAHALKQFGVAGRVQLLGTPAEEDGGGKIVLLDAGAYKNVDVSLMIHPQSDAQYLEKGALGTAAFTNAASHNLEASYHGVTAHAGAKPWEGINALDALVATYVSVAMLRQQIKPTERIHGAIVAAPKATDNSIPAFTKVRYTTRSPTVKGARRLADRVRRCMEGGALAAGCKLEVEEISGYADLRVNGSLCRSFQQYMAAQGIQMLLADAPEAAATDQGNVSHAIPALHAIIGVPVEDESKLHTPGFTKAAGSSVAHERTVLSGKAMAMTGWDIITKHGFHEQVRLDFEMDVKLR